MKKFPYLGTVFRILATIVIIAILLNTLDLEEIPSTLRSSDLNFVTAATLLAILYIPLASIRLKLFLFVNELNISFKDCLGATMCGLALNLFLPTRGGDFAKLAYLRKKDQPSWAMLVSTTVLERGCDILSLGIIGFSSSLGIGLFDASIVNGALIAIVALFLVFLPKLNSIPVFGKHLDGFSSSLTRAYQSKTLFFYCFLASLICWIINSSVMGCLIKSFDHSITFFHAFSVTPPSIIAGIIPVSLWGVGTRDGALVFFLQDFTASKNAISAGFLYTVIAYWLLGLLGLPFLASFRGKIRNLQNNQNIHKE